MKSKLYRRWAFDKILILDHFEDLKWEWRWQHRSPHEGYQKPTKPLLISSVALCRLDNNYPHTRSKTCYIRLSLKAPYHARLLLALRSRPYINWNACRRLRGGRFVSQLLITACTSLLNTFYWISEVVFFCGVRNHCAIMNPPCGRCNKPVYPTEKINCLDKVRWCKSNPTH